MPDLLLLRVEEPWDANGAVERQSSWPSADVLPWRGSYGGENYSILSIGSMKGNSRTRIWKIEAIKIKFV